MLLYDSVAHFAQAQSFYHMCGAGAMTGYVM